jgi:hypothetical protein
MAPPSFRRPKNKIVIAILEPHGDHYADHLRMSGLSFGQREAAGAGL